MQNDQAGARGFGPNYWEMLYAHPDRMECVGNADLHGAYLRAALAVEMVPVQSLLGIGVGLGTFFAEVLKTIRPRKALAIEPSQWAYSRLEVEGLKPTKSTNLRIKKQDLCAWCLEASPGWQRFDLGLCTSVFQYLTESEIERVLPVMAERIEHLYFTVPTDQELELQKKECGLKDPWAHSRSADWYRARIAPHFAVVSGRLLQSRVHYDEASSPFTDLLYRY